MTRFPPNWLQQGTYAASVDRRLIGGLWPVPASVGGLVTVASGMTVNVAPGQVAIPTANNTGTALCSWDAQEQVTLAAAPASGSNRWDLVTAQLRGNDIDGGANNDFIMVNVTGTAAASPTVPATPNNAVALARVYVPGASASVTAGNITDVRPRSLTPVRRLASATTVVDTNWSTAGFAPVNGLQVVCFVPANRILRAGMTFGQIGLTGPANAACEIRLAIDNDSATKDSTRSALLLAMAGNNTATHWQFTFAGPATAGVRTFQPYVNGTAGATLTFYGANWNHHLWVDDVGSAQG